jgi:hypothetical protein
VALLVLWLVLLAAGPAAGQQTGASDAAAYAQLQQRLGQTEQVMARYFFLPDARIPQEALRDLERLNSDIEASYFRDLAERSRMLLFITRQEAELQQDRDSGAQIGKALLKEVRVEHRRSSWRKASAALFWSSLGVGLLSLGGSYVLWYFSERFDQRYLSAPTPSEAAQLQGWSRLFGTASYLMAGVGTLSLVISIPALAGARPR